MDLKNYFKNMAGESGKYFVKILILFTVLGFFLGVMYLVLFRPAVNTVTQQQIFSVTGTAKKYVKPDLATVQLGSDIRDIDPLKAQSEADNKIRQVTDALKALGITDEDIRTTNYALTPIYKYDNNYNQTGISTYSMNVAIEVRTKDFTKIQGIISSGLTAKLSNIGGVNFSIENLVQIQDQIKAEAIKDAKARATLLSNEAGVRLGKVINIQDSPYYIPPIYLNSASIGKGEADSARQVTINPGSSEISATITLTYEIL